MLNSGFRGKRATDGTGAISVQTQSVQATYPLPKINYWRVTDNNYVPYDDTAATSGATIVVYGNNFVSGMTVYINNSLVSATYLDSTRITFTMPALTNGTYIIYMITPQGSAAILSPGITYSGFPSWTASLYNSVSTTVNIQLLATGDGPLTYSLQAGSTLPIGITLTSTGLLTGTATGVTTQTAFTFVVIVDDAQLQSTQQSIVLTFLFDDPQFKYTTLLLNGETTVTPFISDSSTNSFALTIQGDTKPNNFNPYTPGYYSNYFNGSSAIKTPAASLTNIMGTSTVTTATVATLEFWVFETVRSGETNGRSLVGEMNPTSASNDWGIGISSSGYVNFAWYTGSVNNAQSSTTIVPLNTWTHIAVVWNAGNIKIFVGGILQTLTTNTITSVSSTHGYLALGGWNNFSSTEKFTGYISNLRVTKSALYTTSFTPSTTPLTAIANTSLLTCQSNRFIDNSTNNFTITKVGNTTVSSAIPFTPNSSYSTYGSTYFDGTGDYLTTSATPTLLLPATTTSTFECWVLTSSAGDMAIFSNFASASPFNGVEFGVNNGYQTFWSQGTWINRPTGNTGVSNINNGSWTHLAWVITNNGTTLTTYVNGVQNYTTSITPSTTGNALQSIGSDSNTTRGRYFNGYISDLRLVKGTAVYTTAFTPPTSPLTAIANTSLLTLQYNGGATNQAIIDNSNFNNIITRAGNASQGTFSPYSVTGWSNYFDGTGDYLVISSATAFDQDTDFTIEMWINITNYPGSNDAKIYQPNGTGTLAIALSTAGKINIDDQQTGNKIVSILTLAKGVWYHLALVRNGPTTNNLTLYIDGFVDTTVSYSNWQNNATQVTIGRRTDTSTDYTGYVSNLRVVKGTAVYTSAFTPSTSPLREITNTQLLIAQSNTLIDNSINNFTITINGDVSVQAFSPFGSVTESTLISNSTYFNGSSYLNTTGATAQTAMLFGSGDFTIEAWINPTTSGVIRGICNNWSAGGAFVYELTASNTLNFTYNNAASGIASVNYTGTTVISTYVWTHVAIVRNGGFLYHYINGVLDAGGRATFNGTTIFYYNGAAKDFKFGVSGDTTNYFTGGISNLRIVKGQAIYTSTFTPSTTLLTTTSQSAVAANVSILTCQSTLLDNSANAFTLSITGSPKVINNNPFGYTTAPSTTAYTPSLHGGSAYFDGTGDNLTVPNSAFDLTSTRWSIEYWIYPTTIASATYYGLWSIAGTGGFRQGIYGDSGTHYLAVLSGGGGYGGFSLVAANKVITLNNWQHIAFTSDGTTIRQFYNGVQTSTGTAASFTPSTPTVGSWGAANYFAGYMSGFRITRGSAIYTSNFLPPTQALTNYSVTNPASLLLNFTNGGIVDQHGTNVLETVGNTQLSTAVKKYGSSSLYFDGTGDSLKTSPGVINSLGSGDFTIEGWVYPSSLSSMRILSQGTYATGEFLFILNSNGSADFCEATTSRVTFSAGSFVVGEWKHFAIVRSGSGSNNLKGYINGTLAGTGTSSSYNYSATTAIFVGSNPTTASQDFQGYIDDLRITKGYARYTANFSVPTTLLFR